MNCTINFCAVDYNIQPPPPHVIECGGSHKSPCGCQCSGAGMNVCELAKMDNFRVWGNNYNPDSEFCCQSSTYSICERHL